MGRHNLCNTRNECNYDASDLCEATLGASLRVIATTEKSPTRHLKFLDLKGLNVLLKV